MRGEDRKHLSEEPEPEEEDENEKKEREEEESETVALVAEGIMREAAVAAAPPKAAIVVGEGWDGESSEGVVTNTRSAIWLGRVFL